MLAWTIYISFLGAAAMLLLPKRSVALARALALLTAVAGFATAAIVVPPRDNTPDTLRQHRVGIAGNELDRSVVARHSALLRARIMRKNKDLIQAAYRAGNMNQNLVPADSE